MDHELVHERHRWVCTCGAHFSDSAFGDGARRALMHAAGEPIGLRPEREETALASGVSVSHFPHEPPPLAPREAAFALAHESWRRARTFEPERRLASLAATGELRNVRSGELLAPSIARATTLFRRAIGLLRHRTVPADTGIWIDNCNAVHTLGMRATLDLYFLDAGNYVIKIVNGVPPNCLSELCRRAKTVVQLGAAHGRRDVNIGDRFVLQ